MTFLFVYFGVKHPVEYFARKVMVTHGEGKNNAKATDGTGEPAYSIIEQNSKVSPNVTEMTTDIVIRTIYEMDYLSRIIFIHVAVRIEKRRIRSQTTTKRIPEILET